MGKRVKTPWFVRGPYVGKRCVCRAVAVSWCSCGIASHTPPGIASESLGCPPQCCAGCWTLCTLIAPSSASGCWKRVRLLVLRCNLHPALLMQSSACLSLLCMSFSRLTCVLLCPLISCADALLQLYFHAAPVRDARLVARRRRPAQSVSYRCLSVDEAKLVYHQFTMQSYLRPCRANSDLFSAMLITVVFALQALCR